MNEPDRLFRAGRNRIPFPAWPSGALFLLLAWIAAAPACGKSDSLADARREFADGNYDRAKQLAFDSANSEKYDLINKIDAFKRAVESEASEIRFTVEHALKEGREKTQEKLETLRKTGADARVRAEADAALAGLDNIYANAPKPEPIPENIQRPAVIESEPTKRIRYVDPLPPQDGLKKKTSMAPTERARELLEVAAGDVGAGRFRQALELLYMASAEMSPEEQAALEEAARDVKKASDDALAALVAQASSTLGNRLESVEKLYSRLGDFQTSPQTLELREKLESVLWGQVDINKLALGPAAPPASKRTIPSRPPGGSRGDFGHLPVEPEVDELFGRAQTALDAGDYAAARDLYAQAGVAAILDILKKEAASRGETASRLAAFVLRVAGAIARESQSPRELDPGTGRRGKVISASGRGIVFESEIGRETIAWTALSGSALKHLLSYAGKLEIHEKLGAAMLLSKARLERESDILLKECVDADASLQSAADAILARRRGIEVPSYGFVWYQNRWVTFTERETFKLAEKIKILIARIETASTPRERDAFSEELLKLGADGNDALVLAIRDKREELTKKLNGAGLAKKLEGLQGERAELDKARQHALELIFDEQQYFYPYRPPECPPEKAKLYAAVQQEVSARVAAVVELWNSKTTVALGSAQNALRLLHELEQRLRALRVFDAPADDATELYLSIDPRLSEIGIRTLCISPSEFRGTFEHNLRVKTFNASVATEMSKGELHCAELTNQYREMFGRKLLSLNAKLGRSSHKHSKWMSEVGMLTHFSTIPGLRTPFERMRSEGYNKGVSENCAFASGPDGAFLGWQHSSGHHRNMLMPGHTEFGIGGAGAYWTQNFGFGGEYKENPAWRD